MRRLIVLLSVLLCALPDAALAQSGSPYLRVRSWYQWSAQTQTLNSNLLCPAGYIPTGYSRVQSIPGQSIDLGHAIVDSKGAAVSWSGMGSANPINGGGYQISIYNTDHHDWPFEFMVSCVATAVSSDGTLMVVPGSSVAAAGAVEAVQSFCPSNAPVAIGGFSNADGVSLADAGTAPVWGTSASFQALGDVAGGQMGAPSGWQVRVYNQTRSIQTITAFAVCANAPSVQSFIYSVPTTAKSNFSVFGAVPDGYSAVGYGFDVGLYGIYSASDAWIADGSVIDSQVFTPGWTGYDSGSAQVRAMVVRGLDSRIKSLPVDKALGARATVAILAVPTAGTQPPPVIVDVVEFYNASLDHYFISGIPAEVAILDAGVQIKGWKRTGQTFKAYGIGSSGQTGRHPVCRAYGLPSAGLDSHFYSASPDECFATMYNFGGSWALEASEVMQMFLPDATTGACPSGGVPVFRLYNNRPDVNHRYATSVAIANEMIAKGYVSEGYGPTSPYVALCALQ